MNQLLLLFTHTFREISKHQIKKNQTCVLSKSKKRTKLVKMSVIFEVYLSIADSIYNSIPNIIISKWSLLAEMIHFIKP